MTVSVVSGRNLGGKRDREKVCVFVYVCVCVCVCVCLTSHLGLIAEGAGLVHAVLLQ